MSLDTWRSIPEPELVPYQAMTVVPVRSLLVLAPHPDDEIFGCGGLLALAADQGVSSAVAVVTDGGVGGDPVVRERESRQAAQVIGYAQDLGALRFWQLTDRALVPDAALVSRIEALAHERRAQWLLAPSPFEVHPDHRAVCRAAIEAASGGQVTLGFYEVGQPLLPGVLVDITSVAARKQRAMACFSSQLAAQRYDEQVSALNRYRAYTLGPAVTAAEALWFPDPMRSNAAGVLASLSETLAVRLGLG